MAVQTGYDSSAFPRPPDSPGSMSSSMKASDASARASKLTFNVPQRCLIATDTRKKSHTGLAISPNLRPFS